MTAKKTSEKMHVSVGTSGFQYEEWRGSFYPDAMPKAKMLAYYASRFDTTESNYTFRRIPAETTLSKWAAGTPDGFRFSLKAPQKITHFARLRDCAETLNEFHRLSLALGPKLGAVLFQLPPAMKSDTPLLADFLASIPKGMKAAFEFRHESWFADPTFDSLRKHDAALCVAESEDLATPVLRTAPFTYYRLRREDYTDAQIAAWADRIRDLAPDGANTFVYFKHEETGVGPKFAEKLMAQFRA